MCGCIYLNGGDMARDTCMSLHIVLMRGPNDDQLEFPFNQTVVFCLLDQTDGTNHIIKEFHPNTKSTSVQKPESEMNPSTGIPQFLPLFMVQQTDNQFVKDNKIIIKIRVYPEPVSQDMLPFVPMLDPGLPMHIQQQVVANEIERKRKYNQMEIEKEQLQKKIEELKRQKTSLSLDLDRTQN